MTYETLYAKASSRIAVRIAYIQNKNGKLRAAKISAPPSTRPRELGLLAPRLYPSAREFVCQ